MVAVQPVQTYWTIFVLLIRIRYKLLSSCFNRFYSLLTIARGFLVWWVESGVSDKTCKGKYQDYDKNNRWINRPEDRTTIKLFRAQTVHSKAYPVAPEVVSILYLMLCCNWSEFNHDYNHQLDTTLTIRRFVVPIYVCMYSLGYRAMSTFIQSIGYHSSICFIQIHCHAIIDRYIMLECVMLDTLVTIVPSFA